MADDGIKLTDDERDRIRAAIASGYYDHTADVKVSAAVKSIVAARVQAATAERDELRWERDDVSSDLDDVSRDLIAARAELAAANTRIAELEARLQGERAVRRADRNDLAARLERVRALADEWGPQSDDGPVRMVIDCANAANALRAALGEDA